MLETERGTKEAAQACLRETSGMHARAMADMRRKATEDLEQVRLGHSKAGDTHVCPTLVGIQRRASCSALLVSRVVFAGMKPLCKAALQMRHTFYGATYLAA
jgi:hypothetical protein